ncbi:hypothetical protein Tco_1064379 [Tanacetum coccineum]
MYERQKKSVQDFVPIGSAKKEELIKKMNEKATDEDTSNKENVLEEPDSTKVEVKQEGHEDSTRKRPDKSLKMKATKKSKNQKTDSNLEEEEQLKACLMIVPDEEGIIDYEVLEKRFLIINWESNSMSLTDMEQSASTIESLDLMEVLERWNLKSWDLYENCGVHTLILEDGTKIHMLAKRKYPLIKETLERMLALRLIAESESEAVFDLLRFIQQQIDESRSHDGICQKLYGNQLTMLHSKEFASPKQTALGKDISNPLIVDSLLKTIWLSMHHVIAMKHWLFQSKWLLINSVRCVPFEALYGRKYRSLIMWVEVGEGQLIGPELVQETTEKISQIKDRLKAARDC